MFWMYDGYSKIKVGRKMMEQHIYICSDCGFSVRIASSPKVAPPRICPGCGKAVDDDKRDV